jgi:hypothetical protein
LAACAEANARPGMIALHIAVQEESALELLLSHLC